MLKHLTLQGYPLKPALFLAPMAGVTHSAFRRLIADFGGYGALFTEMLSGRAILHENLESSPFTKQRAKEGKVIYQLQLNGYENIKEILTKITHLTPFGIDLNLGCPAPNIRKQKAGTELFADYHRLQQVLETIRENWQGIFSIKCRLGDNPQHWLQSFKQRLALFAQYDVDMIIVHPRFTREKLKRRSRWEFFSVIADHTDIPLIGNGDITNMDQIKKNRQLLSPLSGLMLGRIAIICPWIFRQFSQAFDQSTDPLVQEPIDYYQVWKTFFLYTIEDFPEERALGRIKEFSAYYARNFFYGHELYRLVQSARSLEEILARASNFLQSNPQRSYNPSPVGI